MKKKPRYETEYVRGPGLDFDRQHPDVYGKVLAEVREKLKDAQGALT